ncbi:peptidoglycan-binding domain-containing protein [Streptosporangium sp. NPDC049644]|uniref:peptidoglycan-binding domain-containing protein n=1 Tax=Streptosporangium sp. NPDC049644 TaxID=3155507 RepID=UPI003431E5BE
MTAEESRPRHRARRGGKIAVAILALAVGGVATVGVLGMGDGTAAGSPATRLPPKTVQVTRQTLTDTHTADGALGYGTTGTAVNRLPGTLTRLPGTGDRVTRGGALYRVDDKPVVLMYGTLPAYRTMRIGDEGPDVKQLERNLKALGYTGFTVDDEYTYSTAEAVRQWQEDRGLEESGEVELGRVMFASGAVRVDSLQAGEGDPTGPGRKVLTYSGTAKAVTVELGASERRLARKGGKVTVTLPDGTTIGGRVEEVSTVIKPGGQGQSPTTGVEVVVELRGGKAQKAAAAYVMASVDVTFTAGRRKDVLTVPVAALLALREGGFGVEVVSGSTSSYVPVTTGLFAAGRVEISGDGITEGTAVGVPK